MNQDTIIKIYSRFEEVANIFKATADQLEALTKLIEAQQWQILNLKKRVEALELGASYSAIQALPQDPP